MNEAREEPREAKRLASAVRSSGSAVWGGLFEITEEWRENLGKCEGYQANGKVCSLTDEEIKIVEGNNG